MERIGVRELRQHASRYLARVASGRVVPPTEDGDVLDETPTDFGIDASSALARMREDER